MARSLSAAIRGTGGAMALFAMLLLPPGTAAALDPHDPAAAAACTPAMPRSDPRCAKTSGPHAEPTAPLLAPSIWFTPLNAPAPRAPAAGLLLATICLAWLVLLAFATVIRPRGWRHRPLFGRWRRGDAGDGT